MLDQAIEAKTIQMYRFIEFSSTGHFLKGISTFSSIVFIRNFKIINYRKKDNKENSKLKPLKSKRFYQVISRDGFFNEHKKVDKKFIKIVSHSNSHLHL